MTTLTRPERRFGWWMMASTALYGFGAFGFWLGPYLGPAAEPYLSFHDGLTAEWLAAGGDTWFALTVSLMFTISCCSAFVAWAPRENRAFAVPVILSKAVSVVVSAVELLTGAGGPTSWSTIVTDLPLLVLTATLYAMAVRSVNGSWLRGGVGPGPSA
jgi:hypothetical protein